MTCLRRLLRMQHLCWDTLLKIKLFICEKLRLFGSHRQNSQPRIFVIQPIYVLCTSSLMSYLAFGISHAVRYLIVIMVDKPDRKMTNFQCVSWKLIKFRCGPSKNLISENVTAGSKFILACRLSCHAHQSSWLPSPEARILILVLVSYRPWLLG